MLSDPSFITAFNNKQKEAQEAFYNEYWKRIYYACYRYKERKCRGQLLAKITIGIFEKLFTTERTFPSTWELRLYVYRLARNMCLGIEDFEYDPSNDMLDGEYILELAEMGKA